MYAAIYKLLMAVNKEILFSLFFPLLCPYMQNMYFVPEHGDMGLLCFEAGQLLEQTDLAMLPFSQIASSMKKLLQTDAPLVLLQAFTFKIINLKSSIWLKHLNIRDRYLHFSSLFA